MSNISQRIASLQNERATVMRTYEATLQPALAENRDLTTDENAVADESRRSLERLDEQIRAWGEHETTLARQATPTPALVPGNRPGTALVLATQRNRPQIQMARRDDYKCADFTRMVIAIAMAGHWNAQEYARQRWGDDVLADAIGECCRSYVMRAPVLPIAGDPVRDGDGGNFLTRLEHLGQEFIEMLRPLLIVGRMPNMRRLNFNDAGAMEIPRQTGGVRGAYVGEGSTIPVNRLNFDRLLLVPSKLAVIVPATSEIMRRSDPGLEQIIRDDILAGTALTIDNFFFSQTAAGANPAGILIGATHPAAGDVAGAGGVNEWTDALRAMIMALRGANVPMTSPVWVMNTRTKEYLRLLRTANTEVFAFKAELDVNMLLGYPVVDTNSIPIPWPGPPIQAGDTTVYALIDGSQIIWADDMAPVIDSSTDATISLVDENPMPPTPPVAPYWSAFQNDMILLRLRMSHTWNKRHNVAVAWAYTDF